VQYLKTCCCGCSLRTGTLILQGIEACVQIFAFSRAAIFIADGQGGLAAALIALATIDLIFIVTGLYGAIKYKANLMLIYLKWCVFCFGVQLLIDIAGLAMATPVCERNYGLSYYADNTQEGNTIRNKQIADCAREWRLFGAAWLIVIYAIRGYYLWVIRSFYNELQVAGEGGMGAPSVVVQSGGSTAYQPLPTQYDAPQQTQPTMTYGNQPASQQPK